jgi:hypothetical protein
MIRPVVTYSSDTWTLTAKDENILRIFERQILRKIFGPVNIDSVWRIRNNMEVDNLIEDADIVRFIKAQRIKWLGHIQRMDQARPTRTLLDWKTMGTRPVGRPRQRWQENVMEYLKKMKVKNWKETAKDRITWRDLAEKAKTHKGVVVPNDDDDMRIHIYVNNYLNYKFVLHFSLKRFLNTFWLMSVSESMHTFVLVT